MQNRSADKESANQDTNVWRTLVIPLGVLFVLAVVLLWPVIVHPAWWIWPPGAQHSDLAVSHWPNAHFTRRMLWQEGQFPIWRSTIMSGTPFAANPLAGLYYPPNWVFMFLPWLPLTVGFNLSALFHLWLAGVAMYALMRRGWGVGVWGSLAAAVAYEASPKLLAHLGAGHVGWAQAWAWLPIVVLCTMQACSRADGARVRVWSVAGGAALAMQFCADVRMAAYTLATVVFMILIFVAQEVSTMLPTPLRAMLRSQPLRRYLRVTGWLLAVFLGLSACQWLPMAALVPDTTRSLMTFEDAATQSLPWPYLAGLLLANHGGPHEWMVYVGVSTLGGALLGLRVLWHRRQSRWLFIWLLALLIGAGWFSLGKNAGLFQVLYNVVPGVGLLRVPPRAWVLVVFAAAILAGFGIEALGQGPQEAEVRSSWRRMFAMAVGMFPPLLLLGYGMTVGAPPLNLVVFGMVTPLTVALFHVPVRPAARPFVRVLAILLIVVDLLIIDATLLEARAPERVFAPGRAAAEWLAARDVELFRVYSPDYSIPQHVAERYGLALANGVDPLQIGVYVDYLTRAAGWSSQPGYSVVLPPLVEAGAAPSNDITLDTEMLGALGVRYVASAFPRAHSNLRLVGLFDEVYLYQNVAARPMTVTMTEKLLLTDGTVLYHYQTWPVYAGVTFSILTALGVVLSGGLTWRRKARAKV